VTFPHKVLHFNRLPVARKARHWVHLNSEASHNAKAADTVYLVHTIIAERWSPARLIGHVPEPDDLMSLFEAARLPTISALALCLRATRGCCIPYDPQLPGPANALWAGRSGMLCIAIAQVQREDGATNKHLSHDLGAPWRPA
jgi:hypothetical protein